jgi:hypothetical protein
MWRAKYLTWGMRVDDPVRTSLSVITLHCNKWLETYSMKSSAMERAPS